MSWFETVTGIASMVIALVLMVFVIVGAPAAWQVWQTLRKTRDLVERIDRDIGPLAVNARALADRLGEFNALLKVVQDEAEATFVSTASTIRGVRSGAAAFRHLEADLDLGEDDDGDDGSDEADEDERGDGDGDVPDDAHATEPSARPRLRPRRRARG